MQKEKIANLIQLNQPNQLNPTQSTFNQYKLGIVARDAYV
jgi:hypothetical protein